MLGLSLYVVHYVKEQAEKQAAKRAAELLATLAAATALADSTTPRKVKRGISGYMNGLEVSALPDTGASQNIITLAYAQRSNLQIKSSPTSFTLGHSKDVNSIGKR